MSTFGSLPVPASIALADFSHMLVVNYNAQGPDHAGAATLEELAALRQCTDHVVLCLDTKPYKRTQIYPDYKKGRKVDPELVSIWERTLQRIEAEGYQIARAANEEADDVMATLARIYSEEYGCKDVRIVTQDKDALQCVNESVRVFAPLIGKRGEFDIRGPEYVLKEWGVAPSDFALLLAIMGDTSDHIPGIKGLGKVIGAKLINQYKNPVGMAEACVRAQEASAIDGKLPDFWKKYAAGMAELPKWWQLTTLNTSVELAQPAAAYLERLQPAQRYEDNETPEDIAALEAEIQAAEVAADGGDGVQEQLTPEELEEERVLMEEDARQRAEMAAELPVGPMPMNDAERKYFREKLVYRAPETWSARDREIVQLMEREGDVHMSAGAARKPIIGKDPNADAILTQASAERAAPKADSGSAGAAAPSAPGTSAPAPTAAKPPASVPPPASVAPQSPAPNGARATGGTTVVPPNQGPPKPKKVDALDEPPMGAIVPFAAPSWALSTQPASAGHAFAIAQRLYDSRLYDKKFQTPAQLAAIILRGRELGIGMTTALDTISIIEGRPHCAAQLIAALVERDPFHEYSMMIECTEKRAVVQVKHKSHPKPTDWEYTIDEANALGLLRPSPKSGAPSQWVKRPKPMLLKTAKVIGHRFTFAAATLGLHPLEMVSEGLEILEAAGE